MAQFLNVICIFFTLHQIGIVSNSFTGTSCTTTAATVTDLVCETAEVVSAATVIFTVNCCEVNFYDTTTDATQNSAVNGASSGAGVVANTTVGATLGTAAAILGIPVTVAVTTVSAKAMLAATSQVCSSASCLSYCWLLFCLRMHELFGGWALFLPFLFFSLLFLAFRQSALSPSQVDVTRSDVDCCVRSKFLLVLLSLLWLPQAFFW